MKRLILLVALVMAMAVLAPAAFADDTDEVESADVEMEEKDPSEAQRWKARMIADYFLAGEDGASDDQVGFVIGLRSGGEAGHTVGWGVLYNVMMCTGLADPETPEAVDSGNGWAIGQLCRDYEGDVDRPANFGQLHKDSEDKPGKPAKDMPPQSNKNKHKG